MGALSPTRGVTTSAPKEGGPTAALYDKGTQLAGFIEFGCLSAASVRDAALGGRSVMLLAACLFRQQDKPISITQRKDCAV